MAYLSELLLSVCHYPREAEKITLTTGIHPILSSKLYSHVPNPRTPLYATYFYTTYSQTAYSIKQRILGINAHTNSWQDPIGNSLRGIRRAA
ncbi:hypothetical protein SLEP1_g59393 [Rubroshorea leprosula]|uniref:Uncharacterized protein n=1 Tax=Rubroshorea leprosula TaxID=152421 RepID=A0AAV5MTR7_9ROSI|nr:hypothetical protein SLEP1_g59393 [Rubroshorea leprosula]